MQRLRQQSFIKIQLAEWKKDEELSKGAVFESFVKLQRPKSVDLGSSTVIFSIIEISFSIIITRSLICTLSCFKGAADKRPGFCEEQT